MVCLRLGHGPVVYLHINSEVAEKTSERSFPFWKPTLVSLQQGVCGNTNAGVGKLQPIRPHEARHLFSMACKLRMVFLFSNS